MNQPEEQHPHWHQRVLTFAHHHDVEPAAVTHLRPGMAHAEKTGLIDAWFFIRKGHELRLRYRPASHDLTDEADEHMRTLLTGMEQSTSLTSWVTTVYEPELHAFGGPEAMDTAHDLFHHDSNHTLAHLAQLTAPGHIDNRRELSVLLCSTLLRAAGQEWFEQGDVWAKVTELRPAGDGRPPQPLPPLAPALKRLMTTDTSSASATTSLSFASEWFAAFQQAGRRLSAHQHDGDLTRGHRAVLAHHVIFHWNRLGVPSAVQGRLAATASSLIFDTESRGSQIRGPR
ncbi:thiopeptide-type bacteriocin biosynthesis protein [Streptomyces sp. YIM 98790]|uniref:thiopeptide-type bacteriocin biosynthesis protein n=1 Tax=Streptomyces sp. YIM 98790 TaxID=2689077 RepID=UPI001409A453|nr:thiopeptide-type bacteriocin biosynthesis protein [Streptomyces sp. YIM 98790]